MLFYTQIKREFSHISWKRAQIYFREERVADVKLDGDLVTGKVQGTGEAPYEAAIHMARGAIANSKCSCPAHRKYETHCKHVAALAIWVVERGSLLRAGVSSGERVSITAITPVTVRNAMMNSSGELSKKFCKTCTSFCTRDITAPVSRLS